jgi:hypothetical protein
MTTQGIILLDLIGVVLVILIINLVRTHRMYVAYGVVWLVAIATMMVIVSFPPLLTLATVAVGARFPASALTMLAFVLAFSMLILFSVQLSTIAARQIEMAQAFALAELRAGEEQSGGNERDE